MLIYLKLIRKKDTQFFSFSYSYKTIVSISSIQVPLYCLWKKLSKHKNMSCLYSVRINNGKFHTISFHTNHSSVSNLTSLRKEQYYRLHTNTNINPLTAFKTRQQNIYTQ